MLKLLRYSKCVSQVAYCQKAADMVEDFLREVFHVVEIDGTDARMDSETVPK